MLIPEHLAEELYSIAQHLSMAAALSLQNVSQKASIWPNTRTQVDRIGHCGEDSSFNTFDG